MIELLSWINKPLHEFSTTSLYGFLLNNVELENIEDTYYLSNPSMGINIVLNKDKVVTSIHLFSGKTDQAEAYKGELPYGIRFTMSNIEIEKHLGIPNREGGGQNDLLFGYIHLWYRYLKEQCSIHLQFSKDNQSIELITVASLGLESYFVQNSN